MTAPKPNLVALRDGHGLRALWMPNHQLHVAPLGAYLVVYDQDLAVHALLPDLDAFNRWYNEQTQEW